MGQCGIKSQRVDWTNIFALKQYHRCEQMLQRLEELLRKYRPPPSRKPSHQYILHLDDFLEVLPDLISDLSLMPGNCSLRLNQILKQLQKLHPDLYPELTLEELMAIQYNKLGQLIVLNTMLHHIQFQREFLKDNSNLIRIIKQLTEETVISSAALDVFETIINSGLLSQVGRGDAVVEIFYALIPALGHSNIMIKRKLYQLINKVLFNLKHKQILHLYIIQMEHLHLHLHNFYKLSRRSKVDVFDVLKLFIANNTKTQEMKLVLAKEATRLIASIEEVLPLTKDSPYCHQYQEEVTMLTDELKRLPEEMADLIEEENQEDETFS